MKTVNFKKVRQIREDHNNNILHRMQGGDPLTSFNSYSSWFPPRPIIEKNESDIIRLYGQGADERLKHNEVTLEDDKESDSGERPFKLAQ